MSYPAAWGEASSPLSVGRILVRMWFKTPAAVCCQLSRPPHSCTHSQIPESPLDALGLGAALEGRERGVDSSSVEEHARPLVRQRRERDRRVRRQAVRRGERERVRELLPDVGGELCRGERELRVVPVCQLPTSSGKLRQLAALTGRTPLSPPPVKTHFIRPLATSGCASLFGSTHSLRIPTSAPTSRLNASGCASRKCDEIYCSRCWESSGKGVACLLGMGRKFVACEHRVSDASFPILSSCPTYHVCS